MNVFISVPGQFWAFEIAERLYQRDFLRFIVTTHPRYALNTTLPQRKIATVLHPEIVFQLGRRLPDHGLFRWFTGWNKPFLRWKMRLFDQSVARRIPETTSDGALFVGFSGSVKESVRRANELGYTTVVERASSHIRTQARLLQEEYEAYGAGSGPISNRHIRIEEQEYEEADYIVVPSEFVSRSFISNGVNSSKVLEIPFGYELNGPCDGSADDEAPVFLFAGAATLRKGIHYLLRAWDEAETGDSKLIVAGDVDGIVTNLVKEYRADDSVEFLGWVDDIETLYRRASVLVLPSIEEGSARVVYEAMAHECAIITTSHSGWVGENDSHGIEVPIRDVDQLSAAIEWMTNNDDIRVQYGRNARRLIDESYTREHYFNRVINTYRKLVGELSGDLPMASIDADDIEGV